MALNIKRTEAGSGGKKGHSNMSHWDKTADVKAITKKTRRINDKHAIKEQMA